MRKGYDFSKAQRSKFYKTNARVNTPVYLDEDVKAALVCVAIATGIDFSSLVNKLLKKDAELIQVVR